MDIIFTILILKWLWQQCVPVPQNIMVYYSGYVYYAAVINDPVLVFLVKRQTQMQQKRVQLCIFMFTAMYHVLVFMAYAHMRNEQCVLCVSLILVL